MTISVQQQSAHIQQAIKADGLKVGASIIVNVLDADDYIIAEINVTDRYINFNTGYAAMCKLIPTIRALLEQGYDSNANTSSATISPIKFLENTPIQTPQYTPMHTAEDVIQNYVFKGDAGEPIIHTDPRFPQMMFDFAYENICSRPTDNADILQIGDVSRPDYHPQWFMTREEYNKLKAKPAVIKTVEEVYRSVVFSNELENGIGFGHPEHKAFMYDYKRKNLMIENDHIVVINGVEYYYIKDTNRDTHWLMTREDWDQI